MLWRIKRNVDKADKGNENENNEIAENNEISENNIPLNSNLNGDNIVVDNNENSGMNTGEVNNVLADLDTLNVSNALSVNDLEESVNTSESIERKNVKDSNQNISKNKGYVDNRTEEEKRESEARRERRIKEANEVRQERLERLAKYQAQEKKFDDEGNEIVDSSKKDEKKQSSKKIFDNKYKTRDNFRESVKDVNAKEGKDGDKPKNKYKLFVIPLGGLEEIGKNCTVIQYENEMILVDIGLAFPDSDMHGVDLLVPDFSYVNKNADKLKAIVLTHGHEDHIGGVSHFLRTFPNKDVPIYGSPFTLGLVREKLKEKFKNRKFDLREVMGRDILKISRNIEVEFADITHSIPQAFTVAIRTPEGQIVHSGDYKFDLTPTDGKYADFYKLSEFGEKGTLLLLSDSTNANKEGFTLSERVVMKSFREVLSKAKGRVIVAAFASHAQRVQDFINVGYEFGRKSALEGRSMIKAFDIGGETNNMIIPKDSVISLSQVPSLEENKVLIICTGTQGEEMSALTRVATGQHKDVKIEEGDVVILSANVIPGNEISINRVVNKIMKKGGIVYHHGQGGLHVSGHGCRGDIALMFNLIRPQFFMPVHGEYMHLIKSKELAVDFGINPNNVILTRNGDKIGVSKDGIEIVSEVESGVTFIDNKNSSNIDTNVIRDRTLMAEDGIIIIQTLVNSRSRKLTGQPEIIVKGFSSPKVDIVKDLAKEIVLGFVDKKINDVFEYKKELRELCRKYIKRESSKEPMIIPMVALV